jgi:hypothetical protein
MKLKKRQQQQQSSTYLHRGGREGEINEGNKQCRKEDNKEMQEVGEKKLQKAFLCSTLMKSYAFVIMLLPSCAFCYWKLKFMRKDAF